eukprot:scaffold287424_cov35-Attheya_sp.AAC.1
MQIIHEDRVIIETEICCNLGIVARVGNLIWERLRCTSTKSPVGQVKWGRSNSKMWLPGGRRQIRSHWLGLEGIEANWTAICYGGVEAGQVSKCSIEELNAWGYRRHMEVSAICGRICRYVVDSTAGSGDSTITAHWGREQVCGQFGGECGFRSA